MGLFSNWRGGGRDRKIVRRRATRASRRKRVAAAWPPYQAKRPGRDDDLHVLDLSEGGFSVAAPTAKRGEEPPRVSVVEIQQGAATVARPRLAKRVWLRDGQAGYAFVEGVAVLDDGRRATPSPPKSAAPSRPSAATDAAQDPGEAREDRREQPSWATAARDVRRRLRR
ncbi:MAG: hypothetical protein AAF909_06440 [Pseudomonadota bacterium]